MKVAISGATGLIGTALSDSLRREGAETYALTRRRLPLPPHLKAIPWDPVRGEIDRGSLEATDVVVHLAGETIASPWTRAQKERVYKSRIEGTRLIVDALQRLSRPPSLLLSASAVGYYGDRGDEELDETSPPGKGFLSDVCRAWETEVARASELGVRTASLRFGLVLSTRGGALAKMLPAFKLGLGGPLGTGRQWMSWIHIEELVSIIRLVIDRADVTGALNATAPQAVRNRDFAKTLGRILRRPAIFPVPSFAIKLLFGEMGQTLLLEGQKVFPRRLEELGYRFTHPQLAGALLDVIARRL